MVDYFFQAEDGIRDIIVTGVQTCALPILEDRLCQPFAPARCELGHARRFGVEDRRSPADECDGQKDRREAGGEGQREESRQRETHSRGQRIGSRMAVGIAADKRLQDRGGHLEDERDETDLGERKTEFGFEQRIDRRNHRLHHVVEQVGDADEQQDRIDRVGGRSPARCGYGFRERVHRRGIRVRPE